MSRKLTSPEQNPVSPQGDEIEGAEDVTASDPSTVKLLQANPSISIANKVYVGEDEGNSCGTTLPEEKVVSYPGDAVVFCLTVTNNGDTYLDDITITNAELDYYDDYSVGILAPGESTIVPIASTIDGSVLNVANVAATAVSPSGVPIKDLSEVTDTDPSEVGQLQYDASIFIDNKGMFQSESIAEVLNIFQSTLEMTGGIVASRIFRKKESLALVDLL